MASQSQGWRGPDFKFLSTGISCTCLIPRQTNHQTHSTLTSPITYNRTLFHALTWQIKNVDKSAVEASTYEGKLVFHDLHLEEGVRSTDLDSVDI
jgi:hypothetical protein